MTWVTEIQRAPAKFGGSITAAQSGHGSLQSCGLLLPRYIPGELRGCDDHLFFGGILLMPVTLVVMRLGPSPTSLPKGHPMNGLAIQLALPVPIGLLLALAFGVVAPQLFFLAAMIIVGAHYLPFVSLYGQKLFAVLGGLS